MIIGIGGVSRSGKTTLAKRLARHFREHGLSAVILHQDDFVFQEEQIPKIRGKVDWEHPGSIDFERFRKAIRSNAETHNVVIAEGLLAFYDEDTNVLYDKCFFMEICRETFLERKSQDLRWGKEPGWYIIHIWESFQQYGQPRQPLPEILVVNGEETAVDWEAVLKFLNFS